MLLDALNFNNNMIAGLPAEYLNSCRPTTIITSNTVAANTAMVENQTIMNGDTTNFLLGMPFAADLIFEGIAVQHPFKRAGVVGHGVNIENIPAPKVIVYSAVCD
jgi:hypothetical protein